jgi:hypothetical protein
MHGADKYGAHNWCNNPDWTRYLDALGRHVLAFQAGVDIDQDSGLPVIDHIAADAAILSALQKRGLGVDDRYHCPMPGSQPDKEIDQGGL